jgi:hypothetical protein
VTKAKLEGLFAEELSRLQPTPGSMRLLKESVLAIWKTRQASLRADMAAAERNAHAVQQKLDHLAETFLFDRSIGIETQGPPQRLREGLTLDGQRFVGTAATAPAFSYLRFRPRVKEWWTRPSEVGTG